MATEDAGHEGDLEDQEGAVGGGAPKVCHHHGCFTVGGGGNSFCGRRPDGAAHTVGGHQRQGHEERGQIAWGPLQRPCRASGAGGLDRPFGHQVLGLQIERPESLIEGGFDGGSRHLEEASFFYPHVELGGSRAQLDHGGPEHGGAHGAPLAGQAQRVGGPLVEAGQGGTSA